MQITRNIAWPVNPKGKTGRPYGCAVAVLRTVAARGLPFTCHELWPMLPRKQGREIIRRYVRVGELMDVRNDPKGGKGKCSLVILNENYERI